VRDEAHHPLRHGHTVVVALEASHAILVDLLAQGCLKNLQQLAGIVVDELGVPLEAQHLIADVVRRKRQNSLEAMTVALSGKVVTWSWWLINNVSSGTSGLIHGALASIL